MVKFCVDKIVKDKAYPNLATLQATPYTQKWREFSVNSPFSEPVMLIEHLREHNIEHELVSLDVADADTFYPIALSFFDFGINWFNIMDKKLINKLKKRDIKILFYYSEGDNPYVINEHLTTQCKDNKIPREQVLFVSANTVAKELEHFYYVADDELLFRFRNSEIPAVEYHENNRDKKFTALVRMHKYWRANIMSTIWQQRLDNDGYFAYGNEITADETEEDNPIEVDNYVGLRERTRIFISGLPFVADTLNSDDHNNHTIAVNEHFSNSYLNIVIESHMDVDKSEGVLLTEKTFKPIKNAQPFVIFGAKGSLQTLRELGYKVFDDVFDNRYDNIENTYERFMALIKLVTNLLENPNFVLKEFYIKCKDDLLHNQELFLASKENRLNNLIEEITQ
jgi:hypothetical protein